METLTVWASLRRKARWQSLMQTWMGSPSGADFTTRTEVPGTIPISINRRAIVELPSTETT